MSILSQVSTESIGKTSAERNKVKLLQNACNASSIRAMSTPAPTGGTQASRHKGTQGLIDFSQPPSNVKEGTINVTIVIQVQNWRHLHLLHMKIPNLKDEGKSGP